MMTKTHLILPALWLTLAVPALAGDASDVVLGADNTIYELRQGAYGDLFPQGTAAEETSGVLALDVLRDGGSHDRWLVPGTESQDAESAQVIVYEPESGAVYVFWESVVNGVHPNLYLTSFDGAGWGEFFELIGTPFARKGSLHLLVSRDYTASAEPTQEAQALTVLHVFWSEERSATSVKRYAPIFLIDGSYLGWTPVYDLDALLDSTTGSSGRPISPGIADAIRVEVGKNHRSCVVGFLDPSSHRLRTLELELVAPEIAALGDKIRAEIIGVGMRVGSRPELASELAAAVMDWGRDFHRAALTYMAAMVERKVEASEEELTEEGLARLGDKIRAEIIGVGSRIGRGGVAEAEDREILEITSPWGDGPGHLLEVSAISEREAPEVGGEATLWLSESGRDVLVTWEEGERIYYRESVGDGWSEARFLTPGPELSRDQIYQTLAERVRSR